MLYTYYVLIRIILYLFFITLIYLPYVLISSEEKGKKIVSKLKRNFAIFVIKLTKSQVEVIYDNKENFNAFSEKNLLIVSNHQSFVDIPLLLGYFPKSVGFIAKKEIRKWLIFNLWMDRAQCVFLDRKNPKNAVKSIKIAMNHIKKGNSIVVFPEGTRTNDGSIKEFKKGSFKLATETETNIIPVSIINTYEVMNKHKFKINKNKKIKLIIGKTYIVENKTKENLTNIHKDIREIITENIKKYQIEYNHFINIKKRESYS